MYVYIAISFPLNPVLLLALVKFFSWYLVVDDLLILIFTLMNFALATCLYGILAGCQMRLLQVLLAG